MMGVLVVSGWNWDAGDRFRVWFRVCMMDRWSILFWAGNAGSFGFLFFDRILGENWLIEVMICSSVDGARRLFFMI
jgi:hypothetical protein